MLKRQKEGRRLELFHTTNHELLENTLNIEHVTSRYLLHVNLSECANFKSTPIYRLQQINE